MSTALAGICSYSISESKRARKGKDGTNLKIRSFFQLGSPNITAAWLQSLSRNSLLSHSTWDTPIGCCVNVRCQWKVLACPVKYTSPEQHNSTLDLRRSFFRHGIAPHHALNKIHAIRVKRL